MNNPLDKYKTTNEKYSAFLTASRAGKFAIKSDGNLIPLKQCKISDVAFIAGMWRIQETFRHKITRVRDKDMVLLSKLNRIENTLFEFWTAKVVGYNAYGPFISVAEKPDYIVAKYETDNATHWGYGRTLEEARAFLGLKLFDEYKDLINSVACRNKLKTK